MSQGFCGLEGAVERLDEIGFVSSVSDAEEGRGKCVCGKLAMKNRNFCNNESCKENRKKRNSHFIH